MWEKPSWDYGLYQRLNSQPLTKGHVKTRLQSTQEDWLPHNDIKVKMPFKVTRELTPQVQIILWPELTHSAS